LNVYPCLYNQKRPTIPWFYLDFMFHVNSSNCYNDNPTLKRVYLHNHWVKSYNQDIIGKPQSSTLLNPTTAKCNSHAVRCYTITTLKVSQKLLQWIPYITLGISLQQLGQMIWLKHHWKSMIKYLTLLHLHKAPFLLYQALHHTLQIFTDLQ